MNFSVLSYFMQEYRFDEIKIIGQTVMLQGNKYHLMGMARKGGRLQLYALSQADRHRQRDNRRKSAVMRSSMKEHTRSYDAAEALMMTETLRVDDMVLTAGGGTSFCLGTQNEEALLVIFQLMEAGWQLPQERDFFQTDWDSLQMVKLEFQASVLPDLKNARLAFSFISQSRAFFIEKQINLILQGTHQTEKGQETGGMELAFTLTGSDGGTQDGICYINRVEFVDIWKEWEARSADSEYRRLALEHQTPEEFDAMQNELAKALEQQCPRGMYYIGIEYECTLDVDLSFYSSEYLNSKPGIHAGSPVTVMMLSAKKEKEQGAHGLALKTFLMQEPVLPDTKEVSAELFSAQVSVPGGTEVFVLQW